MDFPSGKSWKIHQHSDDFPTLHGHFVDVPCFHVFHDTGRYMYREFSAHCFFFMPSMVHFFRHLNFSTAMACWRFADSSSEANSHCLGPTTWICAALRRMAVLTMKFHPNQLGDGTQLYYAYLSIPFELELHLQVEIGRNRQKIVF